MKNGQSAQKKMTKLLAEAARRAAARSANTTCPFWGHQDKLPDMVKRLRKF